MTKNAQHIPHGAWPRGLTRDQAAAYVYFIQEANTRRVKIGHSRNVQDRLATLQVGNQSRLILLGTVPGGSQTEAEWHHRFRDQRTRGEWFDLTHEALLEIETAIERANQGLSLTAHNGFQCLVHRSPSSIHIRIDSKTFMARLHSSGATEDDICRAMEAFIAELESG